MFIFPFILGGVLSSVYLIFQILNSTSSTAGVGLLFLPVFFVGGGVLLSLPFWVFRLGRVFRQTGALRVLGAMLLIVGSVFMLAWVGLSHHLSLKFVRESGRTSSELARVVLSRPFWGHERLLEEILRHPAVDQGLLETIWSSSRATGAIRNQVLAHPAAHKDWMLSVILARVDYSAYAAIASNPNLNAETLRELANRSLAYEGPERKLIHTYVLAELIRREDLPDDLRQNILQVQNPEYFLVFALAQSPQITCPQKIALRNRIQDPLSIREIEAGLRLFSCQEGHP